MPPRARFAAAAAAAVTLTAAPAVPADLAPTLADFMAAALANNPARTISRAAVQTAEAERLRALSDLLPTVRGTANYRYNQYESKAVFPDPGGGPPTEIVLTPQEQKDAVLSAEAPLFDATRIARYAASRAGVRAAREDDRAAAADLLLSVARAYYDALSFQEVIRATERAKSAAEENRRFVATRAAAGATTDLAVRRAELEVTKAEQVLIDARRGWLTARRQLATLSGLAEPESLAVAPLGLEPSRPEAELSERAAKARADLAAARERVAQLARVRVASWFAYAPTLSAVGVERYTSAPGFATEDTSWQLGLQLDWQLLDLGARYADVRRGRAALEDARARLRLAEEKVRDEIHAAYLSLEAARAKVVSTRRGAEVSLAATEETRARFRAGTATQLDVILADRDALAAEVDRIRAEGELAIARLSLQRAAGEDLRP